MAKNNLNVVAERADHKKNMEMIRKSGVKTLVTGCADWEAGDLPTIHI